MEYHFKNESEKSQETGANECWSSSSITLALIFQETQSWDWKRGSSSEMDMVFLYSIEQLQNRRSIVSYRLEKILNKHKPPSLVLLHIVCFFLVVSAPGAGGQLQLHTIIKLWKQKNRRTKILCDFMILFFFSFTVQSVKICLIGKSEFFCY